MRAPTSTAASSSPRTRRRHGFAIVKDCAIDLLFTHPRAWGRGAGRALVVAAEDALRDAGCAEVSLWTEERNASARRVYQASGWRKTTDSRSASGTARRCASCATASAFERRVPPHRGRPGGAGGLHGPDRGRVRGRAVRRARGGGRGVRAPGLRRA